MTMQGSDPIGTRDETARAWIVRLASGSVSASEMERLEGWMATDPRNRAAFLRERSTWQDLAAIEGAFVSERPLPRRRSLRWPTYLSVAAAAALAWFAVPSTWLWLRADETSARGQVREIALADGSRAVLDSDSAIAVDYGNDGRDVRLLKGRAWFEVKHGDSRPFRVAVDGGSIRDVGTAFEVDGTGGQVGVGVTEGMVELKTGAEAPVLLRAGQRGTLADGTAHRVAGLPVDQIAGWRRGELLLRNVPLPDAIEAIARYRPGPVLVLGRLSDRRPVSGSFRTDRPDEALDTLAAMRGLEQSTLPGSILLLRDGKR